MSLPGGAADKAGNRYELLWTVICMAEVLNDKADAIRLEPPGTEAIGIEFWMNRHGVREYHSVKISLTGHGDWTLAALRKAGVLDAMAEKTADPTARFSFVSPSRAGDLRELTVRSNSARDVNDFVDAFLQKNLKRRFSFVKAAWKDCSDVIAFDRLRRVSTRTVDESTVMTWAEAEMKCIVHQDAAAAVDVLASFALESVHKELTANSIWARLRERGFDRQSQALTTLLSRTSISILAHSIGHSRNRVAFATLETEPLDDFGAKLDRWVVLYGPPRIGKTCWAIRRAWHWQTTTCASGAAYYLDCKLHSVEDLQEIATANVNRDRPLLLLLDDVHTQPDFQAWYDALSQLRQRHGSTLTAILIARDCSFLRSLNVEAERNMQIIPYPVEQCVTRFLDTLPHLSQQDRVLVGLEASLDPQIAEYLQDRGNILASQHNQQVDRHLLVARHIAAARDHVADKWVEQIRIDIASTSPEGQAVPGDLDVYYMLLPTATLDLPIHRTPFRRLVSDLDGAILRLQRAGVLRSNSKRQVLLNEHPFQSRCILRTLDEREDFDHGTRWLEAALQRQVTPPVRIAEAVFSLCLTDARTQMLARAAEYAESAEWAGTPDVFLDGVSFLLDSGLWSLSDDERELLLEHRLKLSRISMPRGQAGWDSTLLAHKKWWEAKLLALPSGLFRSDQVHYQIGYIDFLRGDFEVAVSHFTTSLQESVQHIAAGCKSTEANGSVWTNGLKALGEMWVTASVRHLARLWTLVTYEKATQMERESTVVAQLKSQVRTYRALCDANVALRDAPDAAWPKYVEAIKSCFGSSGEGECLPDGWCIPVTHSTDKYPLRRRIGMREMVVWDNAIQAFALAACFGIRASTEMLRILPKPDLDRQYESPFGETGLASSKGRQFYLCAVWAWITEGQDAAKLEKLAVSAALLTRAWGSWEEQCWAIYLASRVHGDPGIRTALAQWLRGNIPQSGFCRFLPL